jgi:hypothetical protein
MAEINFVEIGKNMLTAAKGELTSKWIEVKPYAEKEVKAFTENLKFITKLKAEGKINEKQALLYVDIQKSSMRIVLLTIEGLGIVSVENAINAAINSVKESVNTAIGWSIL